MNARALSPFLGLLLLGGLKIVPPESLASGGFQPADPAADAAGDRAGDDEAPPPEAGGVEGAMRVLFVGNSYTFAHDVPAVFANIAPNAGIDTHVDAHMIALPGYSLQQHWDDGRAKALIAEGRWDYIVLQELGEAVLKDRDTFYGAAEDLDAVGDSVGAQTSLFVPWPRQDKPEELGAISSVHSDLSSKLDAQLAPVGNAFQKAADRRPELELYDADGRHPSTAGSYLAAAVFHSLFFAKSPVGADHEGFGQLDRDEILLLQAVAWETVSGERTEDAELIRLGEVDSPE